MPGANLYIWDSVAGEWVKAQADTNGKLKISDVDPFEITQDTPEDLKHTPHGYYATGPSYLPIAVDSLGRIRIQLSSLAQLNDIGDVDVASPANLDRILWNSGTSKWEKMPASAALVYLSASQENLVHNVPTKVNFNLKLFDLGSEYNTTTKKFINTYAGYYVFLINLLWTSTVADKQHHVSIYKDAAAISADRDLSGTTSSFTQKVLRGWYLPALSEIEVYATQGTDVDTVDIHSDGVGIWTSMFIARLW